MKLTNEAIQAINDSPKKQRILSLLALSLDTSEMSIRRYLKDGGEELTKAAALEVIRQETGLRDKDILVKEVATA